MSSDKKTSQSFLRRARGKFWEWFRGLGRQVSNFLLLLSKGTFFAIKLNVKHFTSNSLLYCEFKMYAL